MKDHSWRDDAACLGMDTELFFSTDRHHIRFAIDVCSGCDVIAQCREFARKARVGDGVWAGSERDRA